MTYPYSRSVANESSVLNPAQREADIAKLKNTDFDILVIGGGVVGSGIALDAASRGLSVALVESDDYAAGTSSRSSKLIHGGLRYLEQFDFRLVREALHERELMITHQAPHLVKPLSFLYPLHRKYIDRIYVGAGLLLYDMLRGMQRAVPWHSHIAVSEMSTAARSLNPEIVIGGLLYYDAQVDDARHTMMVARTAKAHGATMVTGAKVSQVIRSNKKIIGATVNIDNESFKVKAKVVIAAAGIWNEAIYEQCGITPGYKIMMSKGVHITLPKDAIDLKTGVILRTPVSVLFIIPWANEWLLGTTDTPYTGDRERPVADPEDVDYIIDQANKVLIPKISREQVLSTYAGIRPLVSPTKDSSTTKISREHTVDHPIDGFVSIAGGKYTTYRIMAKDAVDAAVKDLGFNVPKSKTSKIPLLGAVGYDSLKKSVTSLAESYSMSTATIEHLLNRYGTAISDILNLIYKDSDLSKELLPGSYYVRAEVLYAATHEGARSLVDVLVRRLRVAMESKNHGLDISQECAELIAPVLGWNKAEIKRQVLTFEKYVTLEMSAVN